MTKDTAMTDTPDVTSPRVTLTPQEPHGWRAIAGAPRDGTWFVIALSCGGYEVGCHDPLRHDRFVPVGDDLYRKETATVWEWCGFNNFHLATHWMLLPPPPAKEPRA